MDAAALAQELRDEFATGKTRSAKWRIDQLNGIMRLIKERSEEIGAALKQDMNKAPFETYFSEYYLVREAASMAANNVKKWMMPEKAWTLLAASPAKAEIIPEPLGVVLIISAWNYPFLLSMEPLIGAIAAGNAVLLKPSEVAPASAALLTKLLPLYVDSGAVRVVEGGVKETSAILEQRWDKIFFTGSKRVAKIIMAAAAKHLTPVTLELGGKSPVIIDSTANLDVVVNRVAWGKWASNNGQACVAPDYVLAEESIVPQLVNKLKTVIKKFYGEDPSASRDLSSIVNVSHYNRLIGLLKDESTAEKVVFGGECDEKNLFIAPTVILDPPQDSPIMQEEIFGPLLVILTVKNVDEAVKFVNARPKPLALYLFSTNKTVVETVLKETSSGGVTVNDTVIHVTQPSLPFGGVGESGMGDYHGKHSFDVFSHRKAVLYRSLVGDIFFRYPPFTQKKQSLVKSLLSRNFLDVILIYVGLKS